LQPEDWIVSKGLPNTPLAPEPIGTFGGLCNRTACREPGARWWNSSTRKFYCVMCASRINLECRRMNEPALCDYKEAA
jgi:hypothetical protein